MPCWLRCCYLRTEEAFPSSSHPTCMSCALIRRPNRSRPDMYRWACSPGMAVQWPWHQTGPAALAGCSGGLQERKIKRARRKIHMGGVGEGWGGEGAKDEKSGAKKSRTRVKKQIEVKTRGSYAQSFSYRKLWTLSRNFCCKLESGR